MADTYMKTIKFSEDGDTYHPLPIVDTNDNDKVLMVVDGAWAVTEIANADETAY